MVKMIYLSHTFFFYSASLYSKRCTAWLKVQGSERVKTVLPRQLLHKHQAIFTFTFVFCWKGVRESCSRWLLPAAFADSLSTRRQWRPLVWWQGFIGHSLDQIVLRYKVSESPTIICSVFDVRDFQEFVDVSNYIFLESAVCKF